MKFKRYKQMLLICLMLILALSGLQVTIQWNRHGTEQEVYAKTTGSDMVIPGGMPVGIYMETDGVMILGTDSIKGIDGLQHEPTHNLVKKGDYIVALNNEKIHNKKELIKKLSSISDKDIVLQIRRMKENITVKVRPVAIDKEHYKLGIWVRDNAQGLGTITFLTANSKYGALGHGIHDIDTNELIQISKGSLYETNISNIKKGVNGEPGGLEGIIVYNSYNVLGTISSNTDAGIYGTLQEVESVFSGQKPMKIGHKEDIELGKATIRCTINGTIEDFDINITKIDVNESEINKGIVLEITDAKLLKMTGGIVQGMSGSPIIQNNKLVGAVTHVFVQNSKKGYGIFIENMLKNVKET
ncbi:MAG: SpoIVB peptidase [Lachnospiraceae bacterium]